MQTPYLSLILFIPTIAALIVLFIPSREKTVIRWTALLASLIPLALTIVMWTQFKVNASDFQFVEAQDWYSVIGATYHLGIDGISLTMIFLTTLLTPLALLASFSIQEKVKAYFVLFLLLETGMLGVFMALDLMLFFVFWEVGLVPMYFLINQWGGQNRNYASLKFILFTMTGSLGLLLAIQMIGITMHSFDLTSMSSDWVTLDLTGAALFGLPIATVKTIAFWAFVVAFAVKVPVWPFHTWLPDAHTEAPTAGSMILAGVLLKLGAYGFLRLVIPLFPEQSAAFAPWLAALATLAIIFGALGAFGQNDFKRLVAYSSINHMGFVVLGIAAAAMALGSDDSIIALNGAVLQMFNHGLYAAGMFFLVGVVYDRAHTRDLDKFGGLWAILPVYGTALMITSMASLGLPGLNGFVSEFLVVRGAWPILTAATTISLIGLFFTGAYTLKALWKVLQGPLNRHWVGHLTEMTTRELVVIIPLLVLILSIGLWPNWILNVINRAIIMLTVI